MKRDIYGAPGLCSNGCGQVLPVGVDLRWVAIHSGNVYAFCSEACERYWLDDSQQGAELKAMFLIDNPEVGDV